MKLNKWILMLNKSNKKRRHKLPQLRLRQMPLLAKLKSESKLL